MKDQVGKEALLTVADNKVRAGGTCQKEIDTRLSHEPDLDPSTPLFLSWIHEKFYDQLPSDLKWVENPDTKERILVVGGEFRKRGVGVGRHFPPEHDVLPTLLDRFSETYRRGKYHGVIPLITFAAAQALNFEGRMRAVAGWEKF